MLIPLADRHLTEEDWNEISAAFGANADPRFGKDVSTHFARMFEEIVNLAPAPIGLA